MDYIHCKDIFLLMRDTLKLIDRRPMHHGSRVAYFVYKMLECKGGYEKYELGDIVILTTLHDIGAYKTDNLDDILRYEVREYQRHSIYGYLFFKHLSPLGNMAKVILHHHMDYKDLVNLDYEYKDIAAYINIAEKMDIYHKALGEKFDINLFRSQAGVRLSEEGLNLFYEAVEKYNILENARSGEYKKDLDDIVNYMIFSNEDKKKYLEMLMYCVGFRSEYMVVDTISSICISESLGIRMGLNEHEREVLYYGALLRDIGMLAVPGEIIEAPRNLTKEEAKVLHRHVPLARLALENKLEQEILDIILSHHERGDGSGYPQGLKSKSMTLPQQILQLADAITVRTNKRTYRKPMAKEELVSFLMSEVERGRYDERAVAIFVESYDDIMLNVHTKSEEILATYRKMNSQYEQALKKMI